MRTEGVSQNNKSSVQYPAGRGGREMRKPMSPFHKNIMKHLSGSARTSYPSNRLAGSEMSATRDSPHQTRADYRYFVRAIAHQYIDVVGILVD